MGLNDVVMTFYIQKVTLHCDIMFNKTLFCLLFNTIKNSREDIWSDTELLTLFLAATLKL